MLSKKIKHTILTAVLVIGLSISNCVYANKSSTSRNMEIANVPVQIQLDIPDDQPSSMQLASDVLIIHTHTEEEGAFLLRIFEIPQYIYDEMQSLGWTKKEQREFIMKVNTWGVGITIAWDMFLSGKTTDEIKELYSQSLDLQAELLYKYITAEITTDEYMEKYPFEFETKAVDEVRQEAIDAKRRNDDRQIEEYELTEADMAFCREHGIIDVGKMTEAKIFAGLNGISFEAAVLLRLESADWMEAAQKLENIAIPNDNDSSNFSDIAPNLYGFKFIKKLADDGVISGYGNGTFRPYGLVTRAELVKLLATAFPNTTGKTISYPDTQDHWATEFINKLAGIIPIRKDGTSYYPDEPATREECVASLARVVVSMQETNETINFVDISAISPDLLADITLASELGITNGYEDGSFRPKENVTRMEIAAMIYRALYEGE